MPTDGEYDKYLWENSYCGACGRSVPDCYSDCCFYNAYERSVLNPTLYPKWPLEDICRLKLFGFSDYEICQKLNIGVPT
jgi:hypothetical protein